MLWFVMSGSVMNFNPRSRKGSDLSLVSIQMVLCILFQSALPQGERQPYLMLTVLGDRFQSALPQGERQ